MFKIIQKQELKNGDFITRELKFNKQYISSLLVADYTVVIYSITKEISNIYIYQDKDNCLVFNRTNVKNTDITKLIILLLYLREKKD